MSAPAQSYSILYSALLHPLAGAVPKGYGATKSADGTGYVIATTAALAASSTGDFDGVFLEDGNGSFGDVVQIQRDAKIVAACLPFVGPGIIEDAVLAADGKIRRASATSGYVVGTCDKEGNVSLVRAGGVMTALAGDADGNPLANTVRKILNASVPALAGNVGKALVLASLSAFAFVSVGTASSGYDTADHVGGGQEVLSATGQATTLSGGTVTALRVRCTDVAFVEDAFFGEVAIADRTSDAACGDLWFTGQKPFATATGANRNSGNVNLYTWSAVAGGVTGAINLYTGDTLNAQLSTTTFALGPLAAAGIPIAFGNAASGAPYGNPTLIRTPSATAVGSQYAILAWRSEANTRDLVAISPYVPGGVGSGLQIGDSGAGLPEIDVETSGLYLASPGYAHYIALDSAGVTVSNLAGVGTRMVTCSASGLLGSAAIPTGGAPGGSNTQMQYNNAGAFGGAAEFTYASSKLNVSSSGAITLGATPATGTVSGYIRASNNTGIITCRNAANSADLTVLGVTTANLTQVGGAGGLEVGTGFVTVGSTVASVGTIRIAQGASIYSSNAANSANIALLCTDGANNVIVGDGGFVTYCYGSTVIFQGTSAELGRADTTGLRAPTFRGTGTVAASGLLRGANSTTLVAGRNASNTGDIPLVVLDSSDILVLGASTYTAVTGALYTVLNATTATQLRAGGSLALQANPSNVSCYQSTYVESGMNFAVGTLGPNFNSATNTIYIANGTAPSSAPSNGTYLQTDSGRLRIRSSAAGTGAAINLILDSVVGGFGAIDPDHGIKIIIDKPGAAAQTRWIRFYS